MDYISRFGLEFNPFIKESKKEIVIETSEYNEAIYRLELLLKTRGFGILTGSSGKGKTTIIRNWTKNLNPSIYKIVYITLSTVTVMDFYRQLASGLGLEPKFRKTDNFNLIQDEISRYAIEKRITPVIILDEANYIQNAILNDLKIIFNFDMDSKDRAVVLLTGLPSINNTLRLSAHEPLRQRITMNYHLDGLNKEDAKEYILGKVSAAKGHSIFSESAIEAIINTSGGIPRIINKLCNASLFIGNTKEVNEINNDIIMLAINETELS